MTALVWCAPCHAAGEGPDAWQDDAKPFRCAHRRLCPYGCEFPIGFGCRCREIEAKRKGGKGKR